MIAWYVTMAAVVALAVQRYASSSRLARRRRMLERIYHADTVNRR